jgi:alcohol dehydrogenase (cytochrome c)
MVCTSGHDNEGIECALQRRHGCFYALDATTGEKLWSQDLGGAIAGGVITYTANGAQKVAVAAGFTMVVWPTKIVTAKIEVLGLDSTSASQ